MHHREKKNSIVPNKGINWGWKTRVNIKHHQCVNRSRTLQEKSSGPRKSHELYGIVLSLLLWKLIFLCNNLIREHCFSGHIRLPPQRNKISFFTLLFTHHTQHWSAIYSSTSHMHLASQHSQPARLFTQKLTFLEDSGFSLWTLSNSFFSRFSKALSSAPW